MLIPRFFILISRKNIIFLAAMLLASLDMAAQSEIFRADTLSDAVFSRMQGRSYPSNCTVKRSDLRLLTLTYCDFEGATQQGELVCNKAIAQDLLDIFRELFRQRYPIAQIRLIDDFEADDERSMQANNTSSFCFRTISGSRKLSKHAQGLAIDLNPLQNPCVKRRKDGTLDVQPKTARFYANRSRNFKYKITRSDLAYRLFTQRGFRWGGDWRTFKDYQHFEK